MRRLLALVLCAALPAGAAAFGFCADREARMAFHRSVEPWAKLLKEKRFAEVEQHFGALLARHAAREVSDAVVDRAFWMFAGDVWHEPVLAEWARQFPRSPAAHLALAYHYVNAGARELGDEPRGKPTPAQAEAMRASFRAALPELRSAELRLARPGLAAALRIRIAALDPALGGRARDIYGKAIQADPDSLAVRIQYVKASHPQHGGSARQLAAILEGARGLTSADRRYVEYLVYQELGRAAEWAGDDAAAVRHYERSFPLCAGLDNSIVQLAKLHERKGDAKRLAAAASAILERTPSNGWAYAQRGSAYRDLGRHADAAADYARAVEFGYGPAFEALGWFHENGAGVPRDLKRALELYTLAEARDDGPSRKGHVERVRALLQEAPR